MARNEILHDLDARARLLKEGQPLRLAITDRFGRGKRARIPGDYHLLEDWPLDLVLKMTSAYKYT
jgi:hypothetical protein